MSVLVKDTQGSLDVMYMICNILLFLCSSHRLRLHTLRLRVKDRWHRYCLLNKGKRVYETVRIKNTQLTQSTGLLLFFLGFPWSHSWIIWNILHGFSVHVTRLVFNICYRQLPEMMKWFTPQSHEEISLRWTHYLLLQPTFESVYLQDRHHV